MTEFVITVYGLPGPQGSKRYVGNGVMVESSKKVKPWREDVRAAALQAYADDQAVVLTTRTQPLDVTVTFTLPKPTSAPKRRTTWPAKRPDVDKLLRSTLDAIGSAGIWHDDAQVVELTGRKVYPGEGVDALDRPGAIIRISALGGAA